MQGERLCQPRQRLLKATAQQWIFVWGYKCRLLQRLQYIYHFKKCPEASMTYPNTLPTIVHGEASCNSIWHPISNKNRTGSPISHLKTLYLDMKRKQKRKRHIQSVHLYLWYQEDYDPWLYNVSHSYCRR